MGLGIGLMLHGVGLGVLAGPYCVWDLGWDRVIPCLMGLGLMGLGLVALGWRCAPAYRQRLQRRSARTAAGKGLTRRRSGELPGGLAMRLLAELPVATVVLTPRGTPWQVNRAARQLLAGVDLTPNLPFQQAVAWGRVGQQAPYPPEQLPLVRAMAGQVARATDLELRLPQRTVPVEMTSTPLLGPAGDVECVLVTLRPRPALAMASLPDQLIRYSAQGRCLAVLGAAAPDGHGPSVPGCTVEATLPPALAAQRREAIQLTLATGQPQVFEHSYLNPQHPSPGSDCNPDPNFQGHPSPALCHEEARLWVSGEDEVLMLVRDTTLRHRAKQAVQAQQQLYQSLAVMLPHGLYRLDCQGRITFANPAFLASLGCTWPDCQGRHIYEFYAPATAQRHRRDDQRVLATGTTLHHTETYTTPQNPSQNQYRQIVKSPLCDASGTVVGLQGLCWDVTALKQRELALTAANAELTQLATLDGLTQIPNRRRFDAYLHQQWQRMAQECQPLSLLLFDVDFFKAYNDYYGHQQGDAALVAVAQAAQQATQRAADMLARYGGEEFAVVLPHTRRAGAEQVAHAISHHIQTLAIPHAHSQVADQLTVSIGIASVVPGASLGPEDLLAAADAALYQAKRRGRNRHWIRLL